MISQWIKFMQACPQLADRERMVRKSGGKSRVLISAVVGNGPISSILKGLTMIQTVVDPISDLA